MDHLLIDSLRNRLGLIMRDCWCSRHLGSCGIGVNYLTGRCCSMGNNLRLRGRLHCLIRYLSWLGNNFPMRSRRRHENLRLRRLLMRDWGSHVGLAMWPHQNCCCLLGWDRISLICGRWGLAYDLGVPHRVLLYVDYLARRWSLCIRLMLLLLLMRRRRRRGRYRCGGLNFNRLLDWPLSLLPLHKPMILSILPPLGGVSMSL